MFWLHMIVVFVVLFYGVSRLVLPYYGLRLEPIQDEVPEELAAIVKSLKQECKSQVGYAKAAYKLLAKRFMGTDALSFFRFHLLFTRNLRKVWAQRFLPCTQLNHLYRILLEKSGLFSERDVRLKYTVINFVMHQYMEIKCAGKWVSVDVWGANYGIPFGGRPKFLYPSVFTRQKLFKPAKKRFS